MKLGEYLFRQKDTIACTACGNCCPSICPHKSKELCLIHPTVTGDERRDYVCTLSPTEIFFCGVACPPLIEKVLELTGEEMKISKKIFGVPQLDSDQLKRILASETGFSSVDTP
jgi:hypothetical protein